MKSFLLILIISLLIGTESCKKNENIEVNNLNHNILIVLGHSGMGDLYRYPRNSKTSIETVIGIGADGCEIDIQMTKDSVLVLYHNVLLQNSTNAKGMINDKLWDEIKDAEYRISNEKLLTLENLFELYQGKNLYFSLDCKRGENYTTDTEYNMIFLRNLKRLIDKYGFMDNVFLEGDICFLNKAKENGFNCRFFVQAKTPESAVSLAVENNASGIAFENKSITTDDITKAHNSNKYVMLWGIKSNIATKNVLKKNPDIVQTDKPIYLLMLLNRYNYLYNIP